MGVANHLTVQGYYYLYALFFDYPLNHDFFVDREEAERIRDLLRRAQPILGLSQPFRFDWRLQLFTQRRGLERFSPERVHELLRQLRYTVDRHAPVPARQRRRAVLDKPATPAVRSTTAPATAPPTKGEQKKEQTPAIRFPGSPVNYGMSV